MQESKKEFNLVVTHRDEKTGAIILRDPYTLRVIQASDGGKTRLWERPKNSGNLFNKAGEPVGRWMMDEKSKRGKFVAGAAHIEFKAPETEDQKLARSLIEKDHELAALKAELAAIQAERAPAEKKKKDQGS